MKIKEKETGKRNKNLFSIYDLVTKIKFLSKIIEVGKFKSYKI